MNVRSLLPTTLTTVESLKTTAKSKDVKSETLSKDRDADGRQFHDDQPSQRKLNDEEVQRVLKNLNDLPGVKDNGLTVRLEQKDGITLVYIEEPNGKIIRRIPESELSRVLDQMDKRTGHIFDKAS